jgi:CysZ protein
MEVGRINSQWKLFGVGFSSYFKAIELIFSTNLWLYFLFPIFLNVLLFFGGYAFISNFSEIVFNQISNWIGISNGAENSWIPAFLYWFIWIVFKILYFLVFAYFGGYIVLIILSPVFALLSEKCEEKISGKKYPFNTDQFIRDILRGIAISIRNMLFQTIYSIVTFIISFIPVIGLLMPFVMFFIASYYYGFSFLDYNLERRKLSINKSVEYMKKRKGLAIANGFVFSIFLLIPICGVSLAGFAAIISVVAGTISVQKLESENS